MPKFNFYDIESLENVFTLANYKETENHADIYILSDNPNLTKDDPSQSFHDMLLDAIYKANHNFNGSIAVHDLHKLDACEHLAMNFGLSDAYPVNNPKATSRYPKKFRPVCDTDENYDNNIHPYICSYNGANYDSTMLSMFFYYVFDIQQSQHTDPKTKITTFETKCLFKPTTASEMRKVNDELFKSKFKDSMPSYLATPIYPNGTYGTPNYKDEKWAIRKNMLMTGRHIDIAVLNEKQKKVALKRLLGLMGFQILESDKIKHDSVLNTQEELLDLIAYNMSDVVNLKELFRLDYYQGQFTLKHQLLKTYPELIYDKKDDKYAPDIRPEKVRRDRLYIDSTSSQFAQKSLCPYDHIPDIPVVSFMYPSKEKAAELGIKQVDVLEESKKFFYSKFPQPDIRAQFDEIYNYYSEIRGKNFNESENYILDYQVGNKPPKVHKLSEIQKRPNSLPYFDKNGKPTSCFVNFSAGGTHGTESNEELYEFDIIAYNALEQDFKYTINVYPNPVDLRNAKTIEMPDGRILSYTVFLRSGKTIENSEYKDYLKEKPILFQQDDDGSTKLNNKYVFTSADFVNHEDFESYYPNLLRMMMAFWNKGLGKDRYGEIFYQKQDYGKLMKDKSLSKEMREYYAILREGTKLILNAASGAGDATFDNNIRVNNAIISMRIIGQLFSWRIGQAQTFEGAKILSTNTDGLYSALEEKLNNLILKKESNDIGVKIEPEPMYLISKDSNNRIELKKDAATIINASGGTVGCRKGPVVTKALAHPAIIDWAMTEYLIVASQGYKGLSLDKPFDDTIGMNILKSSEQKFEPVHWLRMFQNILASSTGSMRYIFGKTKDNPSEPIILPHYNRVFYMRDGIVKTMNLSAAFAKTITDAQKKKRAKDNERAIIKESIALEVFKANGVTPPTDKDIVVVKITNLDENWNIHIQNKDLHNLTDVESEYIKQNINYDCYLALLRDCFEKNWRNKLPNRKYISFQRYNNTISTQTVIKNNQIDIPPNQINCYWVFEHKTKDSVDYIKLTPNLFNENQNKALLNATDLTAIEVTKADYDRVISQNKSESELEEPPKSWLGNKFTKSEISKLKAGDMITITAKSLKNKSFTCNIKWQKDEDSDEFAIKIIN